MFVEEQVGSATLCLLSMPSLCGDLQGYDGRTETDRDGPFVCRLFLWAGWAENRDYRRARKDDDDSSHVLLTLIPAKRWVRSG